MLRKHPTTGKEAWVGVHTKKDAGRLGHRGSRSDAQVRVARFSDRQKTKVHIVGVAALLGAGRSAAKARTSRANGRRGGRPRKPAMKRHAKATGR